MNYSLCFEYQIYLGCFSCLHHYCFFNSTMFFFNSKLQWWSVVKRDIAWIVIIQFVCFKNILCKIENLIKMVMVSCEEFERLKTDAELWQQHSQTLENSAALSLTQITESELTSTLKSAHAAIFGTHIFCCAHIYFELVKMNLFFECWQFNFDFECFCTIN